MERRVVNPFLVFARKGYRDLIPVIPTGTQGFASAGKCPGVLVNGKWQGRDRKIFDRNTEALLDEWWRWGAAVGLRCYNGIIAIDVDTLSPEWAAKIVAIAVRIFGKSAIRIGQAPKTLIVLRAAPTTKYRSLRFIDGLDPKKPGLVELLAGPNAWFVVDGIHPKTLQPYYWPDGIWDAQDLAYASEDKLEEFFEELQAALPVITQSRSGDGKPVDQSKLVGDAKLIAEAMAAMENNPLYIGYDEWIEMAAALHGALPDNEGLAEELFIRWSEKAGITNPKCPPHKYFWSLNPPYRLGAIYIYDQAGASGWKKRTEAVHTALAENWFEESVQERVEAGPAAQAAGTAEAPQTSAHGPYDAIYVGPPPPPLFDDYEEWGPSPPPPLDDDYEDEGPPPPPAGSIFDEIENPNDVDDKPRTWKITPAREISAASIEPREWIYGKFLIRQRVALTVAPSETGKTGIGIVDALSIALGKSLLGMHPFRPLRVALWNGEDPLEELERRVLATMQHYKLAWADLGGRLFLNSGFGKDGIEMEIAESNRTGLIMNQPQIRAISEAIRAAQIDVQVLDPFVSTHGVGENDNNSIDRVAKVFARVAEETNCAVSLYHHTRKGSGGQHDMTVDDARGAGALGAAVRSRRALQTMQEEEARDLGIDLGKRKFYFRVADSGNNMAAPDEETTWFEMRNVILPNGRNIPGRPPDEVGVPVRWRPDATKPFLPPDVLDRILAEVDTKRWRPAPNSAFWIGHLIAREHNLSVANKADKKFINMTIEKMVKDGLIVIGEGKDAKRHTILIYERGKLTGVFV